MSKKMTFSDQYKHPNWQKRRLEMLEHYGFACGRCDDKESTLHVHHKQYFKGRNIWEYSDDELEVLCEGCHEDAHNTLDEIRKILSVVDQGVALSLLAGYFNMELDEETINKGANTWGIDFAAGFVASLFPITIDGIEEVGEFVVSNNGSELMKKRFESSKRFFGK